jgi:hypothetical protein
MGYAAAFSADEKEKGRERVCRTVFFTQEPLIFGP